MDEFINVFYEENYVSNKEIAEYEKVFNKAVGMARYGRWKALMHYRNLQSYQGAGEHFIYLNGRGDEGIESSYCPCGLVITKSSERGDTRKAITDQRVLKKLAPFKLNELQLTIGHRQAANIARIVTAFVLVAFTHPERGVYCYKVICQVCGDGLLEAEKLEKDAFLQQHNSRCTFLTEEAQA